MPIIRLRGPARELRDVCLPFLVDEHGEMKSDALAQAAKAMEEAQNKQRSTTPEVTELMQARRTAERLVRYAKARRIPAHTFEYLLHNTDVQERMLEHSKSTEPVMAVVTNHAHERVASSPRPTQPFEDLHEANRLMQPRGECRPWTMSIAEFRENNHILNWEHARTTPRCNRYSPESSPYRRRTLHWH